MFHALIVVFLLLLSFIIGGGSKTISGGGSPRSSRAAQPAPTKVGKTIIFKDRPDFTPNLTPRQMFKMGSFGGTYWRPIHSAVTGRDYKNQHLEFAEWWKGIPDDLLTQPEQDKTKNKYGVLSGTSLEYWEEHGWMHKQDPYGWVQWYCRFYAGRRSPDDDRQIARWKAFAGPNGRFRRRLISLCKGKPSAVDDATISPVIRQGLQHWAYILVKDDL